MDKERLDQLRQAKVERHVDNLRIFTGWYKGRYRIDGVIPQPITHIQFWNNRKLPKEYR